MLISYLDRKEACYLSTLTKNTLRKGFFSITIYFSFHILCTYVNEKFIIVRRKKEDDENKAISDGNDSRKTLYGYKTGSRTCKNL